MTVRMRAEGGFTLLELLIGFVILGLMAGVLFSSFRLALNSYTKSQDRLEQEARKRVLEEQIHRQIGSIFPLRPAATLHQQLQGGLFDPSQPAPAFTSFPLFYGTSESLTFITIAPLMQAENPGLTVVRYGLAEDEWGKTYFGAMESRFMGLDSFTQMAGLPRGMPLPLVEGVEQVTFEYYGYQPQAQEYQWLDSWIGEEMLSVPEAIRIHCDNRSITVPVNANFALPTQGGLQGLIRR